MPERRRTTADLIAECIVKAQEIEDLIDRLEHIFVCAGKAPRVKATANGATIRHNHTLFFCRLARQPLTLVLRHLRTARDGTDEDLLQQAADSLDGSLPRPLERKRKLDA